MRQSEKSWCELLNRLRVGTITDDDVIRLNKLQFNVLSSNPLRACRLNRKVQSHNTKILNQSGAEQIQSVADDTLKGEYAGNPDIQTKVLTIAAGMPSNQTASLEYNLILAVGLTYMITLNISKEDGLVNGALGTLREVMMKKSISIGVWIEFNDKSVGSLWRRKHTMKFPDQTSKNWTGINRQNRVFYVKQKGRFKSEIIVDRRQLPLVLAAAITIHKTQGKSLDELEIDFDGKTIPALHYVALSRCKTENGNSLVSPVLRQNIRVNEKAMKEMERMRKESPFPTTIRFSLHSPTNSVLFQNIESLQKFFPLVTKGILYRNHAMLVFAETRLCQHDTTENYLMPGYDFHRFDFHGEPQSSPNGMAVFTRAGTTVDITDKQFGSTQFVCVSYDGRRLLFIHHRSSNTLCSVFRKHLLETIVSFKPELLMGDVNINLLQRNWLQDLLESLGMRKIVHSYTTTDCTCTDAAFTTNATESCEILESAFSFHKPLLTYSTERNHLN